MLTTPAPDGAALHYLGGPGMKGYLVPPEEALKGRFLAVFCPMFSQYDVATYFPEGTQSFQQWHQAETWLESRHGDGSRIVVVTAASQQIVGSIAE
jgi:hypothetical protein